MAEVEVLLVHVNPQFGLYTSFSACDYIKVMFTS